LETVKLANQFGHDRDFNHATVVDKVRDYHKRLFLVAWYFQRDRNAGNDMSTFRVFTSQSRD